MEDTVQWLSEFDVYWSFTDNDKKKIYWKLVLKCIMRDSEYDSSIHEKHHSLPVSLGGSDISKVVMTFKEHYLAHLLLTKFTVGRDRMKMCFAFHTFFHFDQNRTLRKIRSRTYEFHKNSSLNHVNYEYPISKRKDLSSNIHQLKRFSKRIHKFQRANITGSLQSYLWKV